MTIIASDTFVRANQSGWGTASDGETWTETVGAGTLSINSNKGSYTGATSPFTILLGTQKTYPAKVRVRTSRTSTGDTSAVTARLTANNNFYRVKIASGQLTIFKDVAGTQTNFTSVAFTDVAGGLYWIEFYVNGSTLSASVWQDGNAQPGSYMASYTDTDIATAGQFGVAGAISSSAHVVTFDTFSVDDLSTPGGNHFYDAMSIGDAMSLLC